MSRRVQPAVAARAAGTPLVRRIVGFLRMLRNNGFAVGVGETLDATRVALECGPADAAGLRWGMRALLCSCRTDWQRFDGLFDAYWRDFGVKKKARPSGRKFEGRDADADACPNPTALAEMGKDGVDGGDAAGDGRDRRGASAAQANNATDLRHLADPHEIARMQDMAERLAARMRYRLTRREKLRHHGRRLDLRNTIHGSVPYGGTPLRLVFRRRRTKPLRLVLILDASGSMGLYTSFFVRFIRGIVDKFRETEAFVFHTRLIHVSPALRERDLERALESLSVLSAGWGGGTRIGDSLRTFNDHHAANVLNSRSVVIIMSDGYDTGAPGELAEEMRRLKQRARRVVWLNPLIGWEGYEPLAAGMSSALPYVDLFAPAHNLESLMALEPYLAKL